MSEGSVPKLVVDEKVEIAVSLVGILTVCVATYHIGRTGELETTVGDIFWTGTRRPFRHF